MTNNYSPIILINRSTAFRIRMTEYTKYINDWLISWFKQTSHGMRHQMRGTVSETKMTKRSIKSPMRHALMPDLNCEMAAVAVNNFRNTKLLARKWRLLEELTHQLIHDNEQHTSVLCRIHVRWTQMRLLLARNKLWVDFAVQKPFQSLSWNGYARQHVASVDK